MFDCGMFVYMWYNYVAIEIGADGFIGEEIRELDEQQGREVVGFADWATGPRDG